VGRFFLFLWAILSGLMAFEFYRLHKNPQHSFLFYLQSRHLLKSTFEIGPENHALVLVTGYGGLGLMILTNLYIFRKRIHALTKLGFLKNWLDFHIFCGMMGPTLILFHCDFKVHGLVAISFWSMVVSVSSGIIGRYFYIQISKLRGDFVREAEAFNVKIKAYITKVKAEISDTDLVRYRTQALVFAGADAVPSNPLSALVFSMITDVKMAVRPVPAPPPLGEVGQYLFKGYALNMRKANTVDSFNRLMGYWHTFHMPFAIFMYIAAVLHVAAEFWLGNATF